MSYTVTWSTDAESELAEAWLDAADRTDFSRAAAELEDELCLTPFRVGAQRASSVNRYASRPPIGIVFDIVEDDKKVIVQACWLGG